MPRKGQPADFIGMRTARITFETSTDVRYAAAFRGSADISQRLPDLPAKAAGRLFLVALPNQNADHSTRKRIRIAECSLILSEAKAPQPTSEVHGGALTPPGAHDPPGETTRPGHCFRMTAVGSKPVKLRTRMFFGFPPKRTSDPCINEYSPNRKGHQRRGALCQSSSSCFLLNDHVGSFCFARV